MSSEKKVIEGILGKTPEQGTRIKDALYIDQMEHRSRESASEHRTVQKGQYFWGMLMVLSLFVMVLCGEMLRKETLAEAAEADWQLSGNQPEVSESEEEGIFKDIKDSKGNSMGIKTEDQDGSAAADETENTDELEILGGAGLIETEAENPDKEGDADQPMIALTFDDGPYTSVTNRILDVLEEYEVKATFFVVGSRLDFYSDTLKRIEETGCEIGNHTYSHRNLNELDAEGIKEEINSTQELLNSYVTGAGRLVRPPYGNANETVQAAVKAPMINWSLDSEDWKSRDADAVIQMVLEHVQDGDIILMHDLYEATAEAVEYLVPELVARGYRLLTVSELFAEKNQELIGGTVYRKVNSDLK